MRLATWNCNNVRKRLPQLISWLDATQPDIVVLQELKTETAAFPRKEVEAAGYSCLVVGQKTWNGVALLARFSSLWKSDESSLATRPTSRRASSKPL